jgi:hypothetical protein
MDHYRQAVADSQRAIVDPQSVIDDETSRMKAAAAELKFEQAGKIKARIDQLSQFGTGKFRFARRVEDFRFLSFQRGPREGTAKIFLVTPSSVEEIAGLIAEPKSASDLLRYLLATAGDRASHGLDDASAERIGLVAHHLFLPKQTQGVFLRITEVADKEVGRAYRDLRKQKEPDGADAQSETAAGESSEGVVRELEPELSPPPSTFGPPDA